MLAPLALEYLTLQCKLMAGLDLFIPAGSHILSVGECLVRVQDSLVIAKRRCVAQSPKKRTADCLLVNGVKQRVAKNDTSLKLLSNVYRSLCITASDLENPQIVQELADAWLTLCASYLGLMARHPSFPEVSAPFVVNLKRLAKCKNEHTRTLLKRILSFCTETVTTVTRKRSSFSPTPNTASKEKFLVFTDSDCSLSRFHIPSV